MAERIISDILNFHESSRMSRMIINPYRYGSLYVPYAATFNGDDISISASMAGIVDGTVATLSFWIKFHSGDGTLRDIIWSGGSDINIRRNASNQLEADFDGVGGASIIDLTTSVTQVVADGWVHWFIVVDSASSSACKIYKNGVQDTSVSFDVFTGGTLNLNGSGFKIGAGNSDLNPVNADISDLWFAGVYHDVVSHFISNGRPVDLGINGSVPTGSIPALYCSRNGAGDNWAVDSTGNNTFVLDGTLDVAVGPP